MVCGWHPHVYPVGEYPPAPLALLRVEIRQIAIFGIQPITKPAPAHHLSQQRLFLFGGNGVVLVDALQHALVGKRFFAHRGDCRTLVGIEKQNIFLCVLLPFSSRHKVMIIGIARRHKRVEIVLK